MNKDNICPECFLPLTKTLVECKITRSPFIIEDKKNYNGDNIDNTSILFAECEDCGIKFFVNHDTEEVEFDTILELSDIIDELNLDT